MTNSNPHIAQELLSHQTFLRRLAIDLVGEDSDDLVQEVWRRALERPPHHGRQLRGWLARVARNLAADRWRGEARRRSREEGRASEQPAGEDLEARLELRKSLVGALDSLSPSSREAILLRYFEGLAPRDIARRQGTPVATVKTRLRRGLAQLREALDERHGGDRATWMSAVSGLTAPLGSGGTTGTLAIGGIVMGTMIKVSAALLVAATCVYFVARTPGAESPRMATVEPLAADEELAHGAESIADENPAAGFSTPTGRRSPVAEEPPGGVSAARGTNMLRVVLEGITKENALMTTVTLTGVDERDGWPAESRDSWPCQGLTSEFDLDPFLASVAERDGNLPIDELEVTVDHPLHLLETARVTLTRGVEQKSGQTVYEVRVQPVPACLIHGRLVRADGAPAAEGLVGAMRLEGGVPMREVAGAVDCAADGAFELRVRASGHHVLVSHEEGQRPTTSRVEALVGTRVDVGTLVIEPGHAITGQALRQGYPVSGASVSAQPRRTSFTASFVTRARSVTLYWLESRFELLGQRVDVDENGAFAFIGLAPGEYLLREERLVEAHDSLPGYWDDAGGFKVNKPALTVHAPEDGVVLEFRWTLIRFELAGDLLSEDEGRLLMKSKTNTSPVGQTGKDVDQVVDPEAKGSNTIFEFQQAEFHLNGDEPTFVLQAPPNKHMTGEVAFPGLQPVPLDFWTPEPGGEVVVPVQLARGEETATVVIDLENPQAEIPETFTLMLKRAGHAYLPETRPVEVRLGQLRVEGISPGQYRATVFASEDPNHPGLHFSNEFDLDLHPGQATTRSIRMRQGAGLRLTLRNEEGELLSGKYKFFDHLGGGVRLVLLGDQWKPGSDAWATASRFGPGTQRSSGPINPGRYRLVLLSPGYAEQSVTVDLRAGEYEDVVVTLSR